MIFYIIIPGIYGGLGNYFIPIYLNIPEITFPRINNYSLLLLLISYKLINYSIILEYSIGVG
jgi:cytochrome c oxidase subunit 1